MDSKPKKKEKRGLVYLPRPPPYMKPEKIRHIFSQFGEVDRVYLVPMDSDASKKKKTRYKEGWVEFISKKVAKNVALSLNNTAGM